VAAAQLPWSSFRFLSSTLSSPGRGTPGRGARLTLGAPTGAPSARCEQLNRVGGTVTGTWITARAGGQTSGKGPAMSVGGGRLWDRRLLIIMRCNCWKRFRSWTPIQSDRWPEHDISADLRQYVTSNADVSWRSTQRDHQTGSASGEFARFDHRLARRGGRPACPPSLGAMRQ
jgi:hypothetical protein